MLPVPGSDAFVWDAASGELLATLGGHGGPVLDIAFAPDGSAIATACADGRVRIFDGSTYALVTTIAGHVSPVTSVAFSPDGQMLASSAGANDVRLWATNNGDAIRALNDLRQEIEKARPGEAALAAVLFIGGVRGMQITGAPTPGLVAGMTVPARVPVCATRVAFSPDGKWVAAVIDRIEISFASRFHLYLMNLETGATREINDYHSCDVAFDPTASKVIGGGYGGISIYDLGTGARMQ